MPGAATEGVISGTSHGSSKPPSLPGGAAASAREKPAQSSPNMSRTRSRASDPFEKQVSPMNPPVGAPNTCPVPV